MAAIVGLKWDESFSIVGLGSRLVFFSGDFGCPMAEAMRSFAASASANKLLMDHMNQIMLESLMSAVQYCCRLLSTQLDCLV
jgi:hypothetical protein